MNFKEFLEQKSANLHLPVAGEIVLSNNVISVKALGEWAWNIFNNTRVKRLKNSLKESEDYLKIVSKDAKHYSYAKLSYETSLNDWKDVLLKKQGSHAFTVYCEIAIACLGEETIKQRLSEMK